MDEAGARALMEQAGATPAPPSAVDIGLARQRGRRRLRLRRWALGMAPVLAAAAVAAIIFGTGALAPGPGGGTGTGPVTSLVPPKHPFNPLAPYAAFGWLPPGVPRAASSPSSTPTQLQLMTGSQAQGAFSLTVWARGTCNLDAGQVRAALRRHRHPLLNCAQNADAGWAANLSRPAPAVAGRPGFWFDGQMLAWEYARDAWATLSVGRAGQRVPPETTVKVAAHLKYAATAKPSVKFPFRLTGVPASWRMISVSWRATPGGLLAVMSRELGSGIDAGPPDGRVAGTIGQIVITPGTSRCTFFQGSSRRVVLDGAQAIVTDFPGDGARPYQGLCIPQTQGLHVSFLEFLQRGQAGLAFGGVTGVFLHHLRLLGPDPANWTTHPLG